MKFPIRQDIEILSADDVKQLKLGWTVKEVIGMAVINTRGLHKPNTIFSNGRDIIIVC